MRDATFASDIEVAMPPSHHEHATGRSLTDPKSMRELGIAYEYAIGANGRGGRSIVRGTQPRATRGEVLIAISRAQSRRDGS